MLQEFQEQQCRSDIILKGPWILFWSNNIKEAEYAERDTRAEQLCAEHFVVWFGFRRLLEKEALLTVTAQHVTHTHNSTYGQETNKTRTTRRALKWSKRQNN
jgi:hypothetical protein